MWVGFPIPIILLLLYIGLPFTLLVYICLLYVGFPVPFALLISLLMGCSSSSHVFTGGRYKMVLVVDSSLKMSTGKIAAQVGHATLAVYQMAMTTEEGKKCIQTWQRRGQPKIVLTVRNTEQLNQIFTLTKNAGLISYLVQDAGYTQVPNGSRTVLGIFGPVQAIDEITGHLKVL